MSLSAQGPLIVARRGARAHAPENTLPAFELAIAQGADAIEMDVQFTSDGELILMQGLTVDDISNGTGRIRSHTLAEIRALDVGSWFSPAFAGLRVPTLAEALDALAGRVQLVLELKSFTSKSEEMEGMVWAEIKRRGLGDQVTVTSFNPFLLRRLRKMAPDLRTGLMIATGVRPLYMGKTAQRLAGVNDVHVELAYVTPRFVAGNKRPLWVWPVNSAADLAQALAWNPAALITDDPAWLRRQLAASPSPPLIP